MTMIQKLAGVAAFALVTLPADAQIAPPLDVRTPIAPSPVMGNGQIHLAYELHATNFSPRPGTLTRVEALDAASGASLVAYEGEDRAGNVRTIGAAENTANDMGIEIGAGARIVIYMWISVEPGVEPESITHRLSLARVSAEGDTTSFDFDIEPQPVGPPPVVISAPLRGENWFAANGPSNTSDHRRALIPIGGRARIAQRFATDWVQLFDDTTNDGDREDNSTYHAWGRDALAVADAIVVDIKDGIPENVPGIDSRAVEITLETVGGNYVILDLGVGNYAFYAHLQPGSLRVAVGDQVRTGEVVGLVGNSGNSTEPHLHFHVANAPSPLGSEGVPFVLDSFEVTGRVSGFGQPAERFEPERRVRETPMAYVLVRFGRR